MGDVMQAHILSIWIIILYLPCKVLLYPEPTVSPEMKNSQVDQLVVCPAICTCNNLNQRKITVDCSNRNISQVPSPLPNNTVKLFLDRNALEVLGHLDQVPALEIINLSHNALSNFPPDAFKSSPKVRKIDTSGNKVNDLPISGAFHGLSYLQSLTLSNNIINYISDIQFRDLGSLTSLNISYNNLSRLEKNAFKDLHNLETLDLSHNQLTNLQQEWFYTLGNLKKLVLSYNRIQNVSNTLFWSLNNLETMDLSHNAISLVGRLSFKGLLRVTKLDLSYNGISILQEGTTRYMEHLSDLDLSHNPIVSFDGTFKYSPNILSLRLVHTRYLKELTASSLQGLTGLLHLNLSHSALTTIHPRAFVDLVSLRQLQLSTCQLKSIPKGLFATLNDLHSIHLHGNPWHCDCLLFWLLKWLEVNRANLINPLETSCETPLPLKRHPILDSLDHNITCNNARAEAISPKPEYSLGSDALLSCNIAGDPKPDLSWQTPKNFVLHVESNSSSFSVSEPSGNRMPENYMQPFEILPNGTLKVKHVVRAVTGVYRCIASNELSNSTAKIPLILSNAFIKDIRLMSIWVGLATSLGFLLLTLAGQLVTWIMDRCGWTCPCCRHMRSSKGQQLWRVLENMEGYKSQQLERLRENYNHQAQKIKDNCMQQMEWLRESYSCQVERLRDIRDYGTQQIDKIRDNYYSQVQKVRDYSNSQIDRLRENYIFQRTRIRKFSAHQLLKLRENYKVQQQHLNKILETLNLDNCKVNCSRTDSIILNSPELTLQPANLAIDFIHCHLDYDDTASQISAYYTPKDSNSETSSSIFDNNQSKDKIFGLPAIPMMNVSCSTTDLHLYQNTLTDDMSMPLLDEEVELTHNTNNEPTISCNSHCLNEDFEKHSRPNADCPLNELILESSKPDSTDMNHSRSNEYCPDDIVKEEDVSVTIV